MSILADIVRQTWADLRHRFPAGLPDDLPATSGALRRASLEAALRSELRQAPRVIAEIKRASPSKGLIRSDFRPGDLARELAQAGAVALSVLTEPHFFQGSREALQEAAGAVAIPVLRKDFIVHEVQLAEAIQWGASAVLLIAAALSEAEYARLYRAARGAGLEVLTEVHAAAELDVVLAAGAHIIGVNSRDLKTFRTDLAATAELLERIPDGFVRVAESGIRDGADLRRLRDAGADAFLVGETLMRAPSPGAALRGLLAGAAPWGGEAVP